MTEFALFSIPTALYILLQARSSGSLTPREAATRAGLTGGTGSSYLWALGLLPLMLVLAWLVLRTVPAELFDDPGIELAQVTSVAAAVTTVFRAFGEEILFRGLLGGIFVRRLGFTWGNLLQAFVFLVPHLWLLAIDVRLWPVLPLQFATGWVLGWLRHRSDSIVPGGILHSVANLAAGFLA